MPKGRIHKRIKIYSSSTAVSNFKSVLGDKKLPQNHYILKGLGGPDKMSDSSS